MTTKQHEYQTDQASAQEPKPAAALERQTPPIITTPEEFNSARKFWNTQHYNVLSPFTNLSGLAREWGIITTVVQLSPNKDDGDVYYDVPWVKEGEAALAKKGLRRLADACGISTYCDRTDNAREQNYWAFKVRAEWKSVDGSLTKREINFEWDLRDGSPRMKGWTQKQIDEARKHGGRGGESRAINAGIREYGIKQSFKKEELSRPFIAIRATFMPNMDDPEVKRIMTAAHLGVSHLLYPAASEHHSVPIAGTLAELHERDGEEVGPKQIGRGTSSGPMARANEPPTPEAVRIVRVDEKSVKGKTIWEISTSTGEVSHTTDGAVAQLAKAQLDAKGWVEISAHGGTILELTRVGDDSKY